MGGRDDPVGPRPEPAATEARQVEPPAHRLALLGLEQLEHHLDERVAAQVALDAEHVDQLFERRVVVGVGAQGVLAHPGDQLAQARVAREVPHHDQGVDEKADHVLEPGMGPPGDRGTDEHLVLAAIAGEQALKAGQQDHEQGGPFASADTSQRRRHLGRDLETGRRPLMRQHGRARAVGGQLERGGPSSSAHASNRAGNRAARQRASPVARQRSQRIGG